LHGFLGSKAVLQLPVLGRRFSHELRPEVQDQPPFPAAAWRLDGGDPGRRSKGQLRSSGDKLSAQRMRLPGFSPGQGCPVRCLLAADRPLRIPAPGPSRTWSIRRLARCPRGRQPIARFSQLNEEGFEAPLLGPASARRGTALTSIDIRPPPGLRTTKGLVAEGRSCGHDPARIEN